MRETLRRLFLEGKLKGPSQKGFDPQQWRAAFRQLPSPSTADQQHFEAALWFGEQFKQLRAYFDANPLPPGSPEKVLRRVVGVVNRECLTAINTAQQAITASQGPVTASDIIEGRITLAGNVNEAPPAQVIESAIDGLRFDLEALQRPRVSSREFDVPHQLLHLRRRVNFTVAYHVLEEEWLECIHQGWIVNAADSDAIQLRPGDPESAIVRVVSEYRDGMLLQELNSLARRSFDEHSAVRDHMLRSKVVRWRGPEGTLVLGYPSMQMAFPIHVARLSAAEPDLEPFTLEPLAHRGGLTLLQLVDAWAALAPISWDLSSQIPLIDIDHPSQLEGFAPLLPMDALISTLSAATELSPSQCETVIDTLTWRNVRDSLWLRPLVKVGDNHRIVVIPALRAPNLRRSVEYWLSEGEWDLGKRGNPYEEHVRKSLAEELRAKKDWSRAGVVPHKLKPPDPLVGDLDLVVWIGNQVLIGETKCFRRPATVHEWFQHEDRIRDAVQQLRRKVDYARAHPEWLAAQIREAEGHVDLARLSVSGCVVLNSALGALQVIDEVPIIDLTLLSHYFDPGHADVLVSKNPIRFEQVTFYGSQEDAAQNLEGYLRHPPHVGFYKTSIVWEERRQLDFAHPGRMVARVFPAVRLAGKEGIRLP